MKLLIETNDPTIPPYIEALLSSKDIRCFIWDVHISVLEGSIGIFPRRVMVMDCDYEHACEIMKENNID